MRIKAKWSLEEEIGKTLLKGTYSSGVKAKKGSRTIIINQQIEESGGIKSRMKAY